LSRKVGLHLLYKEARQFESACFNLVVQADQAVPPIALRSWPEGQGGAFLFCIPDSSLRRKIMKGTSTLENVIGMVHGMSADHHDETIPVTEMEFDNLSMMWVSGKQVEVAPSAQRLLANRLRVPHAYLNRCPKSLQAENLNYWLEQEAKHRDTFFCRFDGNRLRAVFTERYQPLDNMEILAQLMKHGFDPEGQVQYAIDDSMFLVKIPEFGRAFGLNAGYGKLDEIVPGVSFANSEVGLLAFSIEAFFYRLVCTNGMIVKTSGSVSRFKHISNRGLENFPGGIGRCH
jgi:hypothetical protein